MAWSRFLMFALLAVTAAGCGSSSSSLATTDAERLHRDVASIRAAATAHNPAAAHRAVRTLEADVSQLRAANRIAPADASVLLGDAGQVGREVPAEMSAPVAPTAPTAPAGPASPTSSASPAQAPGPGPQAPAQGKAKEKGHGHGHGKGQGDGGDGGNGGD